MYGLRFRASGRASGLKVFLIEGLLADTQEPRCKKMYLGFRASRFRAYALQAFSDLCALSFTS